MSTSETQKQYAYIVGVYAGEDYNTYRVIFNNTAGNLYLVNGNSKASSDSRGVGNRAINEIHEATIKNGSVVFDGTTYETPTQGSALPSSTKLSICANSTGTIPARARIYSVKVTKDGVVKAEFVPARNSSDVVGMYDLVRGQFFTNAGTGTFVAGPEM